MISGKLAASVIVPVMLPPESVTVPATPGEPQPSAAIAAAVAAGRVV